METRCKFLVVQMATDFGFGSSYLVYMTRKPYYPTPPAGEMNQWVRDALQASGMTQQALADALTAHAGVGSFAKSMVNKMTKSRKISMDEARAISTITGHPLPPSADGMAIVQALEGLEPGDRNAVINLIRHLAAKRPDA